MSAIVIGVPYVQVLLTAALRPFLSMPRVTRHLVRPAGLGWPLTNAPWGF
jgi:hypothetical protein